MQNIPDKDLDNLFKQAAELAEVKYYPEAWQRMERKLDAAQGGRMRKVIYGLGALALIGALFFQVLREQSVTTSATFAQLPAKDELAQAPSTAAAETELSTLEAELTNREASSALLDRGQANPNVGEKNRDAQASRDAGIVVKQADEASADGTVETAGEQLARPEHPSGLTARPDKAAALPAGRLPFQMEKGKIAKTVEPERTRRFKSHFSAGLSVSPDFSGVGLSSFSKTGTNLGISLQYHISRRFSLATGVIRSRKAYEVKEGFKPYEGYWKYHPKPDLIDGGCTVLDIPVNVRYNFLAKERNKMFLSLGVSSYLMLQEEYAFIYSGTGSVDYEVRNQNRHYLGILNASAGYERMLGRRWGLQVEPFVKLPVEEIGVGNLKLLSAGAFITLNYHFFK